MFYSDTGKKILQQTASRLLSQATWAVVFPEPFPPDALKLTNHPLDAFTSSEYRQIRVWAIKEKYPLCWKKNTKKIYRNSSFLRGRSWGSKEGHRVQSRVCVETAFGCQLANVSVTVLSAALLHFIKKCPAEHSWMRTSWVPQQTAMLLQLLWLGKARQLPCRCFGVTSWCGDSLCPPVEHLAGNMDLELTSLTPSRAFWIGPGLRGGHRFFQHTGDAFPASVVYQQMREKGRGWTKPLARRTLHLENAGLGTAIVLWPKCLLWWKNVVSSLEGGKGRI